VDGPSGRPGLVSVLANRRFSLWLGSSVTTNLGYSAWSLSILWLAYQLSGTLLLSAAVLFVQWAVYALTFLAGPVVDRLADKRTLFLVVFPLEALIAAFVGVAVAGGSLSVPWLLGAVVAMAVLDDLWWTAGNTVPRILVGTEGLLRANGLQSAMGNAGSLAGYAVGAVILAQVGPDGGLYLRAILLVASTVLLLPVHLRSPPAGLRGFFTDLREGWSLLATTAHRVLLRIGVVLAAVGFFSGAPVLLITLFAHRAFGGSSSAYGALFASYMFGVIASGLAVGRTNPRRHVGPLLIGATVCEGAAIAAAVLALPHLLPSAGVWFLVGLAAGVPSTLVYAYVQAVAPAEAVGRLVSNLEVFPAAASSAGAIAIGFLAAVLAPASLAVGLGVGLLVVGLAAFAIPAIRTLRF